MSPLSLTSCDAIPAFHPLLLFNCSRIFVAVERRENKERQQAERTINV
jgi:hypothetical protein